MINEHRELKFLPVNKTVLFQTPLEADNFCVVRTGVYSDENNSFIHAFLSGYSKEYYNLDNSEKDKFILKFKKTVFDKKSWINDKKYYKYFIKNVNDTLLIIYKFIEKIIKEDQDIKGELSRINDKITINIIKNIVLKNINLYDLMSELIPIELLKDILDTEDSNFSIKIYKQNVVKNLNKILNDIEIFEEIEEKRVKFIKNNIEKLFITTLDEIDEDLFKFYINKSKMNPETNILNILTNKLNRNIYFIDSDTRLPFIFDDKQIFRNENKNIILLKLNDRYEILGQLLKGNKIKREFDSDEYLINKINKLLFGYEELDKEKENNNEEKEQESTNNEEKEQESTNNKEKEQESTNNKEKEQVESTEEEDKKEQVESTKEEDEKDQDESTKEEDKKEQEESAKEEDKKEESAKEEENILDLEDDDFEIPKRKYSMSESDSESDNENIEDVKKTWFSDNESSKSSEEDSESDSESDNSSVESQ